MFLLSYSYFVSLRFLSSVCLHTLMCPVLALGGWRGVELELEREASFHVGSGNHTYPGKAAMVLASEPFSHRVSSIVS